MNESGKPIEQIVSRQRTLLTEANLTHVEHVLATAWNRLKQEAFQVLVIGEYNRGKSMLLNALVGRELFVSSAIQQTAINTLRYAGSPTVTIIENNVSRTVALESLPTANADRVEVSIPSDLLANGLIITELPSFSDNFSPHTSFQEFASNADLIVMVLASDSLYSNTERQIVEKELTGLGHTEVSFVVNFLDRLSSGNQADIRTNAMQRLPAPPNAIFFTSALNSLESGTPDDGITRLHDALLAYDADTRRQIRERRLARLIKANMATLRDKVKTENESLQAKQQDYDQHLDQFQKTLGLLKTNARQIDEEMNTFRDQTRQIIETRASNFFRELGAKIESWMREEGGTLGLSRRLETESAIWQQDVSVYLRSRLNNQTETLQNSLAAFELQLQQIAAQIPDFSIPSMPSLTNAQEPDIHVRFDIPMPQSADSTSPVKRNVSLIEMPEVLIVAVGSVIVGIYIMPWVVIPSGLAVAGVLAFRRMSNTRQGGTQEGVRSIAADLRRKGDEVTLQVAREAETYFAQIQDTVHQRVNTIVGDVEKAIRTHLATLRPTANTGSPLDARLSDLEQLVRDWRPE